MLHNLVSNYKGAGQLMQEVVEANYSTYIASPPPQSLAVLPVSLSDPSLSTFSSRARKTTHRHTQLFSGAGA